MKLDYKFTADNVIKQNKISREDIETIKTWLLTSSENVVPSQIQDELVVLFLLSCDNDIKLTKKTIISYYKCRKQSPEIFDQRLTDGEELQRAFKTMNMIFLPGRTEDNLAMLYFSLKDTNYKNLEVFPIMKVSFMLMDLEEEDERKAALPPDGIIYLVDFEGFGLMHLTKFSLSAFKKYFEYLIEGLPMKFMGMHFLNTNFALEKFLAMLKLILSPHLLKKLYMHPRNWPLEELHKIFPKRSLPQELGGDLEPEDKLFEKTIALLKERQTFFDNEEKLRKEIL